MNYVAIYPFSFMAFARSESTRYNSLISCFSVYFQTGIEIMSGVVEMWWIQNRNEFTSRETGGACIDAQTNLDKEKKYDLD